MSYQPTFYKIVQGYFEMTGSATLLDVFSLSPMITALTNSVISNNKQKPFVSLDSFLHKLGDF